MLYLVGLGLADEKDITVKGLEVVKRAERVYLESYTSILLIPKEKLVGNSPIVWPLPVLFGYGGGRRQLGPHPCWRRRILGRDPLPENHQN